MRSKKALLALTAAGFLGATSAAWPSSFIPSEGSRDFFGGFVKPCSLDGVNPAYHRGIFGNPAVARSYGFYVGPDRLWHVVPGCRSW
jgi:hypothetical protein